MKTANNRIRGLLLNDATREAGESVIDGKTVSWDAGYLITILPVGARKGTDARKIKVAPEFERSITAQLSQVNWGSLITLDIEDGFVVSITVENDWMDNVVLDD